MSCPGSLVLFIKSSSQEGSSCTSRDLEHWTFVVSAHCLLNGVKTWSNSQWTTVVMRLKFYKKIMSCQLCDEDCETWLKHREKLQSRVVVFCHTCPRSSMSIQMYYVLFFFIIFFIFILFYFFIEYYLLLLPDALQTESFYFVNNWNGSVFLIVVDLISAVAPVNFLWKGGRAAEGSSWHHLD